MKSAMPCRPIPVGLTIGCIAFDTVPYWTKPRNRCNCLTKIVMWILSFLHACDMAGLGCAEGGTCWVEPGLYAEDAKIRDPLAVLKRIVGSRHSSLYGTNRRADAEYETLPESLPT